jgi:hypothetical protein
VTVRSGFLFALACLILAHARVSLAEDRQLQVTLEISSGSAPTQLCVVAPFVPPDEGVTGCAGKSENSPKYREPTDAPSCQWPSSGSGACGGFDQNVARALASNGLCAPEKNLETLKGDTLWCERKPSCSENVLALRVDAGITHASMSHSLIQLSLDTPTGTKQNTVAIKTVGGDYLSTAVASHRDPDKSDRAALSLIPRCASSRIFIPRYQCPPQATKAGEPPATQKHPKLTLTNGDGTVEVSFTQLQDVIDLPLPSSARKGGSLTLSDCGQDPGASRPRLTLEADWTDQPPSEIHLKARDFPVQWQRDPLSIDECPSQVSLPEVPLKCDYHLPPDTKQPPGVRPPSGDQKNVCYYQCVSPIPMDLPTKVTFDERIPSTDCDASACDSATNRWELPLLVPGETIDGYLPLEQRSINLRHFHWGDNRAARLGDRVTSIWIATPDGKAQYVGTGTQRLLVPNVRAQDSVSYRYFGDRLFDTRTASVHSGGIVELADPDTEYTRGVQPGLAFSGGWRHVGGARESTAWNPQGGVELALAIPKWRSYLAHEKWYIEPEIHIGATVTTQAYESVFQATSADSRREFWHNVLILMVPLELTFRAPVGIDQLQLDVGAGVAWYRPFYAADSGRLAPNFAVSAPRITGLWRLTRAVSLGIDSRLLWGFSPFGLHSRRVVQTFDAGGLLRREEVDGQLFMFGPVLRLDDVF